MKKIVRTKKANSYALLFFIIVSLLMVGPHLSPLTKVGTTSRFPFDANVILWNFWWTYKSFSELQNPYWTDLLFHPDGTSLAFHAYPLTYSVFSIPFQLCLPGSKGLALAFNCIVFISFVLSGWGAYLLTKHVTGSRPAALLAGLIFAFMPFHFRNMARLHVAAIEFLPFYILSLLKLHEQVNFRRALAVGVWLTLAFYTSLEYALFLVIFSAMWLCFQLVGRRSSIDSRFFGYLALAAVVFILLASPLLHQQMLARRIGGSTVERTVSHVVDYSPALLSLVIPSRLHPVYGDTMAFAGEWGDGKTWGMRSESSLSIITLTLAIASIIWCRQRKERIFWTVSTFTFLILCLGPYLRLSGTRLTNVPMPYLLLYKLFPPLRPGRDPTRLVPLAMLSMAILAAFGVSLLLQRIRRKRRRVLLISLLVLLVLFENLAEWPRWQLPEPNPFYKEIAKVPGEFALIDLTFPTYALMAQTIHGKKLTTINLISRAAARARTLRIEKDLISPERFLNLDPKERAQRLSEHNTDIRKLKIKYVIFAAEPEWEKRVKFAQSLGASVSEKQDVLEGTIYICVIQDDIPCPNSP